MGVQVAQVEGRRKVAVEKSLERFPQLHDTCKQVERGEESHSPF
jgi:hypothetical protein